MARRPATREGAAAEGVGGARAARPFALLLGPASALLLAAPCAAAQLPGPTFPAGEHHLQGIPDPRGDGWDSEVLAERAAERLRLLGAVWARARHVAPEALAELAAEDVSCTALRPARLEEVGSGRAFRVLRPARGAEAEDGAQARHEGLEGLALALGRLATPFEGRSLKPKFKVVGVEPGEAEVFTELRLMVHGSDADGTAQITTRWRAGWRRAPESEALLLFAVELLDYEEVQREETRTLFADVTASAFVHDEVFQRQLAPGLPDWKRRLPAMLGLSTIGDQGIAVGDVDGDGLEDLYVCQPGGLPNRLFLRRPDGTLADVSGEAGVDCLDLTTSALLVDLDGDGDLDLVLALESELLFLENDGEGRFRIRSSAPVAIPMSLAAADYDLDGRLDVYVCGYFSPYDDQGAPVPYHDAENGQPNVLLRNEGDFRFRDVTSEVGLDANNRRFSFAAAWEDYDGDGWPDLYVANDFGRNNLYRNLGGNFVDVAAEAGVEDVAAGMGVTWGDYDGDGLFDLYVSNMESSAGKRVVPQGMFQPAAGEELMAQFRRHARGNSLFRNLGDGTFADVSEELAVTDALWAWGAIFVDLDGDGRLDLFSPNGFVTNERLDDL